MTDKKALLLKLNKNLNVLKEREAKFAGQAPLELLNQIEDHEKAISLTRRVITDEISEEEWNEELKSLLLAVNNGQAINIEAETYIAGDVKGDVVHGNQIITNIYETPPPSLPPAEAQERRALGILLNKVKTFWIEGVLKKSIHQVALIDLGKETQAEAVAQAWEQVLELPDQSRQTLPPDKKISQIFDEMNRALLILGEPGSGKTITLLQLAQDLIARTETDTTFGEPVPVVFNLSSWVDKEQSLIDWMVSELTAKYQIPKRIGRQWLENNRLLPLLDGLDEVRTENQAACVEAINHFGEEFGLAGLVVCSRLKEYTLLPVRLKLNGAIRLQPLTLEQIYDYLDVAGSKLAVLRSALQEDNSLQEIARSPLILGIMTLAYQDVPIGDMTQESLNTPEKRRQHLFDTYIERMFRSKGRREKPYSDEQTKGWLSYLAQQMAKFNFSIFQVHELQPIWLSSRNWRWGYVICSRVVTMLIAGASLGILMGVGDSQVFQVATPVFPGLMGWLIAGLLLGLCAGGIMGVYTAFLFQKQLNDDGTEKPSPTIHRWVFYTFGLSLMFLLINSLILVIFTGLFFGLLNGFSTTLIFILAFGLNDRTRSFGKDIQPPEILGWSWQNALKILPFGLLGGFIVGLVFGSIFGLDEALFSRLSEIPIFSLASLGVSLGIFFGLLTGTVTVIVAGIESKVAETKTTLYQGIWLSVRNAIALGVCFGLLGLISFWPIGGVYFAITNGLAFGILGALFFGGDVIYHFILTGILWYQDHIPRRYTHFLDYSADRIFLQKVGGGYIFIHRLLMEHFAAMTIEAEQSERLR